MASTSGASGSDEYTLPGILLAVGAGIYATYAFYAAGPAGVVAIMLVLGIAVVVQVIFGIIACYITAAVMKTGFGLLVPAFVKLAAAIVLSSAIGLFIPFMGGIIRGFVFMGLVMWLFQVEFIEAFVLAIVTFFVELGAVILLAGMMSH